LVLTRNPSESDTVENLYEVGVAARILKTFADDDDNLHILVGCLERITLEALHERDGRIIARVEYHPAVRMTSDDELKAYSLAVVSALKDLMKLNPLQSEAIRMFLGRSSLDDPGQLADFAANLTSADGPELQKILAEFDVRRRIEKTLTLLRREVDLSRLQQKITKQIEERMSSQQRQFFLKEQLKAIKQELGLEKDGKAAELEKFQQRLQGLVLNEEAQKAISDEIEKLQVLEPSSPEYTVARSYLDWLTILPWGVNSKDNYSLRRARRVLDRDHYGLNDVKERILEFIAVGKMRGNIAG